MWIPLPFLDDLSNRTGLIISSLLGWYEPPLLRWYIGHELVLIPVRGYSTNGRVEVAGA